MLFRVRHARGSFSTEKFLSNGDKKSFGDEFCTSTTAAVSARVGSAEKREYPSFFFLFRLTNVQFGSDGEESATKLLKKFSSEVEKFVILATK
jgi:hypothetical protein